MQGPLASVILFCSLPLAAQTFVVDVQNGLGTDYTSLAAAVTAVPDGAVLSIRAGNYFEGVVIDGKSLTLLGEPGAQVFPSFAVGFHIQGLAADQSVAMRGLHVDFTQATDPTIYCDDNLGLVVLDDVSTTGRTNVRATNCAALQVRDSSLAPSPFGFGLGGLYLQNCTAAFEDCTAVDVRTIDSNVQFADCTLSGSMLLTLVVAPAIDMNGGELRIHGGTLIGANGSTAPQGQVITGNGDLRIDPTTGVVAGPPPFGPGINATTLFLPKTTTTRLYGTNEVLASSTGEVGNLAVMLLGIAAPAAPLPGLDPLWLDNANVIALTFGVHAGPPLQHTFALPPSGAFPGVLLAWQSLDLLPAGGLELSNPSTHCLN